MTSSLSFTVSTLASPSKQYMIYANNFWRRKKTAERCIKSPNEINLSTPIYDLINGLCVLLSPSLSVFVFVYMYLNEWNNCCLNLCISLSLVICIPGSTPYLWKKRSTNRQLHLIFSASNVWVEDGPSPTTGSVFGWKCAKSESLNLRAKPSLSWASANNDATPREQEPTNRLLHLIFSSLFSWRWSKSLHNWMISPSMEKALSLNLSWSWSYVFSLTTGYVANKSNETMIDMNKKNIATNSISYHWHWILSWSWSQQS